MDYWHFPNRCYLGRNWNRDIPVAKFAWPSTAHRHWWFSRSLFAWYYNYDAVKGVPYQSRSSNELDQAHQSHEHRRKKGACTTYFGFQAFCEETECGSVRERTRVLYSPAIDFYCLLGSTSWILTYVLKISSQAYRCTTITCFGPYNPS